VLLETLARLFAALPTLELALQALHLHAAALTRTALLPDAFRPLLRRSLRGRGCGLLAGSS
jgi:hypothetical protein